MTGVDSKTGESKKRKILGLKANATQKQPPYHDKGGAGYNKKVVVLTKKPKTQKGESEFLTQNEKDLRIAALRNANRSNINAKQDLSAPKVAMSAEGVASGIPVTNVASERVEDVSDKHSISQSDAGAAVVADIGNLAGTEVVAESDVEQKAEQQDDNNTTKKRAKKTAAPEIVVRRVSIKDMEKEGKSLMRNLDHISAVKEESEEEPKVAEDNNSDQSGIATVTASLKKQQKKKLASSFNDDKIEAPAKFSKAKFSRRGSDSVDRGQRFSASQIAHLSSGADMDERRRNTKKKDKIKQRSARSSVPKLIEVYEYITVQDLASKMSVKSSEVIKSLMGMGVMATINETVDADVAEIVISDFGHKIKRLRRDDEIRDIIGGADLNMVDAVKVPRPPVVTVMGHVDHGKTSLLDALRMTDVAADEYGGITQHIGAYSVTLGNGKAITFLDTPGHEDFTAMRMRGASITDIIVLVVAGNDGIKAQTIEAISHAKAAEVPIIVAVNKMDLPSANIQKVKDSLMSHGLTPDEYGGDTMVVGVSALTKMGLDKLEETILLQAEMLGISGVSEGKAKGHVLESKLDRSRGVSATLIVKSGTLKLGDIIVVDGLYGKVKAMNNDHGVAIEAAGPSIPVEILGLSDVPTAGDEFIVLDSDADARKVAEFRNKRNKELAMTKHKKLSLDQVFANAKNGAEVKDLVIIVRGDVHGSLEAIEESLTKIKHSEVAVKILMKNVGAITESDIALANASNAIVIGFNVRAIGNATAMAEKCGVEIRYYSVIYDMVSDIKDAMSGLLKPIVREEVIGTAEVRLVFNVTNIGKIAGSYIRSGTIKRGAKARILRDNVVIYDGVVDGLQRNKDAVKEVSSGYECGILIKKYTDLKEGDVIEAYKLIEEARKI